MNKEKLLPENWFETKLEEISNPVSTSGKKIKTKDALPFGKYPVIDQGISPISGYVNDPSLLVPASIDKPIIIFGDHTRIVKYVTKDFVPGADGTKLIRAKNEIDSKYLKYLIQQADIPDRGYSRHYQFLKSVNLPLAPKNEQRRIADKLDTVLTRVDAVQNRLARITPLLKRFRQSVLAAATSGRLTEDWRRLRGVDSNSFTSDQPPPELSDLKIPSTWSWKSVKEISSKVTDGVHKKPNYLDKGIPFLNVSNLTAGIGINFDKIKFISKEDHNEFCKRTKPEKDDILISKDGTLGVVRRIQADTEFSIFVSLALVKPLDKRQSKYLEIAFSSPHLQIQMKGVGTGIQHIHLTDLRKDLIPLPPFEEQTEIVRRVEILLAYADRLEARLQSAQTAAERLTPALLAKAFRGELVPQDPNDEPATELLRRLREAAPLQKKTRVLKARG